MPCLFAILMVAFPRVAILLLYFFTNFFVQAYHSILLLILGFIFLPLTTIVYAWLLNAGYAVTGGVGLIAMIIAVIVDLGLLGGGEYHRRRW